MRCTSLKKSHRGYSASRGSADVQGLLLGGRMSVVRCWALLAWATADKAYHNPTAYLGRLCGRGSQAQSEMLRFDNLRLLLRLASATRVLTCPAVTLRSSLVGSRSVGGSDGGILRSVRAIAIT